MIKEKGDDINEQRTGKNIDHEIQNSEGEY